MNTQNPKKNKNKKKTSKVPVVADNILSFLFLFFRENNLGISYELSAWQKIHMKC